jgi:hypothetical protein
MPFRGILCSHLSKLPPKQAVMCDRSSSSISATASLTAYIMEDSLTSAIAEPVILQQILNLVGGWGLFRMANNILSVPALGK